MPHRHWASGAECVNPFNGLAKDFLVKVEDGVQRLILRTGRVAVISSELVQESFQFLFAGKGLRHSVDSLDVATQPVDITGLSGESSVLATHDDAQPLDSQCSIHRMGQMMAAGVGQRPSNGVEDLEIDYTNQPLYNFRKWS